MSKITDAFGREATQGEDGIWRTGHCHCDGVVVVVGCFIGSGV